MNYSTYRISLDVHKPDSGVVLNAKRGDTKRKIIISLHDGSVPYHIGDNCYAVFTAAKPDGNIVYNECTIEDSMIVYTLTEQTTAVEGMVDCEIKLYGAEGNLITSPKFIILVHGTVYNEGDEVESSDEFSALTKLVSEVIDLKDKLSGTDVFVAEYDVTTFAEIQAAASAGKAVFCVCPGCTLPLALVAIGGAVFAGVSDPDNGIMMGCYIDKASNTWSMRTEAYSKTGIIDENSTDDQVPTALAVYNALTALEKKIPEGGGGGGSGGGLNTNGGLSTTAVNLLMDVFGLVQFHSNPTGKLEALKEALLAGSSGDSGSGNSGGDGNDTGGEETVVDDITVSDGVMTITTVGSAITVADGVMTIA